MTHDPADPKEREASLALLEKWYWSVTGVAQGHHDCQHRRASRHLWLGIPAIIFSAAGGSALVYSASAELQSIFKLGLGLLTLVGGTLTTLGTFLRHETEADKHRVAAVRGGALLREIDQIRRSPPDDLRAAMSHVRAGWDSMQTEAPELPEDTFKKYHQMIVDGLPPDEPE